jgi:hypothetical protein
MNTFRLPFFAELKNAQRILIAGAGGGFDVFSGLPLYFNLQAAGKEVFLANLSFSNLLPTAGRRLTPNVVEINADSDGSVNYFPEKQLSSYFRERMREVPIYCFERVGPKPITESYRALADELKLDTVILVDGGTDSLMRGDESGLGTPQEDIASIAAVDALDVPRKMLVCLGFGIDAFHGVCHAHVLEAIADLIRAGGYLGAFSLTGEMPEVQRFVEATRYVLDRTPSRVSIVCTSILAAIEGRFGNYHQTERTFGSELFVNPLMAFYWCFHLREVAKRILYLDSIRGIEGYHELTVTIERFHGGCIQRPARELPM